MFDIKKFRKERNIKQETLATELGYNRSTIANMESGRQPITDSFLDKIGEVYGVEVEGFKSYNQPKDDLEEWKNKYYKLLEENNRLLNKLTQCLEDKEVIKDQNKSLLRPANKHVDK